eukprot:6173555-Pleurochrysis_carterae.AAC.1
MHALRHRWGGAAKQGRTVACNNDGCATANGCGSVSETLWREEGPAIEDEATRLSFCWHGNAGRAPDLLRASDIFDLLRRPFVSASTYVCFVLLAAAIFYSLLHNCKLSWPEFDATTLGHGRRDHQATWRNSMLWFANADWKAGVPILHQQST